MERSTPKPPESSRLTDEELTRIYHMGVGEGYDFDGCTLEEFLGLPNDYLGNALAGYRSSVAAGYEAVPQRPESIAGV